jgi:cytochrome c-type biogenesis protein CcmH
MAFRAGARFAFARDEVITLAALARLFITTVVVAMSVAQAPPSRPGDLEEEARAIDAMLIAPCCFTQQVSVHQSPAAEEVRRDVRARLAAGQTRQQILDAYVAQYGKRILAQPPAAGFDTTLYLLPLVLLIGTAGVLGVLLRRFTHTQTANGAPEAETSAPALVSPGEQQRLDDQLRDLD